MNLPGWNENNPPFSFLYGGARSADLLPQWKRVERAYQAPDGLRVSARMREFTDFPAVEWVLEITNPGHSNTPILEQIMPLDVSWPVARPDIIQLHHARGDRSAIDDFLPLAERIAPRKKITLAPTGGRSSNGVLPFMNLQFADGGYLLAIGWSGQWTATFDRSDTSDTSFRLTAGMERTHLSLRPGETIRTPRILLIRWEGDDPIRGNNLLRQVILQNYTPRLGGQIVFPPVAAVTFHTYCETNHADEAGELEALARAADLGAEAYWVDACWYGTGKYWWEEVGNWFPNKERFPRGLKPVSDAAHARGMQFVLWFEPERVRVGTQIEKEHPEFLLRCDVTNYHTFYGLLNLGAPDARAWLTNLISNAIVEHGIDIYRHDFNNDPLPYWKTADGPDRMGMTEIRYIEGLYAMWDELRRRHPNLIIDSCASGGKRIDLETLSRSLTLWRSDFQYMDGPTYGKGLQVGDQSQSAGLCRWMPLSSQAVWTFSPYDLRSALSAGMVVFSDVRKQEFPSAQARLAIAELKRLRPFLLGNFHPLLSLTVGYHDWCAYQYHRRDLNAGFAVFLRRHESPFPTMEVALREIEPQRDYRVVMRHAFDDPSEKTAHGSELARLTVTLPEKPGSMLLEYSPVS